MIVCSACPFNCKFGPFCYILISKNVKKGSLILNTDSDTSLQPAGPLSQAAAVRAQRAVSLVKKIGSSIRKEVEGTPKIDRSRSLGEGKALRKTVRRREMGVWEVSHDRKGSLDLIFEQEKTRLPDLIPVRHERMSASAFAFYRAAAVIMTRDLAQSAVTGIRVQACGDAHISNFGIFASPERRLVFDINDFDETLPGPWEWDIKRLCTSVEICGRDRGFSPEQREQAVRAAAQSYCRSMHTYSEMGTLDVWYDHMDLEKMFADTSAETPADISTSLMRKTMEKAIQKNRSRALDRLTEQVDGHTRIISNPPLIVPFRELSNPEEAGIDVGKASEFLGLALRQYRLSLPKERRYLIDQYTVCDAARKVVGVGSVGTRAWIIVLEGDGRHDPLILQVKEAGPSVLEPYAGKSEYLEHGRRVIEGQRVIQTAGDILTGWVRIPDFKGQVMDYYVRQLWDSKGSLDLEKVSQEELIGYAALCAQTLAHAHAKTGDRHAIAAYLGKGNAFADAMTAFAGAYADQNQIDYEMFLNAIN